MHCQKYRCSYSPPALCCRLGIAAPPLAPTGPQLLSQPSDLHLMTLHVRSGSWRRPQSNDSQPCLALRARCQTRRTAKTVERYVVGWMAPKRRGSSPSLTTQLPRLAGGAVLAGDRNTDAGAENDVAWVGSDMPQGNVGNVRRELQSSRARMNLLLYTASSPYGELSSLQTAVLYKPEMCIVQGSWPSSLCWANGITSSTAYRGSTYSPYPWRFWLFIARRLSARSRTRACCSSSAFSP